MKFEKNYLDDSNIVAQIQSIVLYQIIVWLFRVQYRFYWEPFVQPSMREGECHKHMRCVIMQNWNTKCIQLTIMHSSCNN